MTTVELHSGTGPPLAAALARFERLFQYPLGAAGAFRIDHREEYPRFFRSLGEAACFAVEDGGEVRGTVAAAVRTLISPAGEPLRALYIADLKVSPRHRGGRVLLRLLGAVHAWCRSRGDAAFGIVMDGNPREPQDYTGRLGIPRFAAAGRAGILRAGTGAPARRGPRRCRRSRAEEIDSLHRRLNRGRYSIAPGKPLLRSSTTPLALALEDGSACGLLEDTRLAKRLFLLDGREMLSAHLSSFAYETPAAGAALLEEALAAAGAAGFPALFTAVPAEDEADFRGLLHARTVAWAGATVFTTGLEAGAPWSINTSEI